MCVSIHLQFERRVGYSHVSFRKGDGGPVPGPVRRFPDTCRPSASTARCTTSVTTMRTSLSLLRCTSASAAAPGTTSSHVDVAVPPSAARTTAGDIGVPNVTLRCAPGRGKYFHGAWRPSGMSLSKPACVRAFRDEGRGGRGRNAPVIHMGMIVGGRGVSIKIRPLKRMV